MESDYACKWTFRRALNDDVAPSDNTWRSDPKRKSFVHEELSLFSGKISQQDFSLLLNIQAYKFLS